MTRRERVIMALRHRQTDIVPYQVDFTFDEYQKVKEYTKDENFFSKIGNHMLFAGFGSFEEIPGKKGYYRDYFGVVWNRAIDKDIGNVEYYQIPDSNNYTYKMPPVNKELIRRQIREVIERREDKFIGYAIGFSLFERAWTLKGMENLLMDMIENPDFVYELMNDICKLNLEIISVANEFDELDAIHFGDDWGQQKGQIMGAHYWRKFIKPFLKQMYAAAKSEGKFVTQHSCGDIEELFPDLIEIGLDAYNTFQPEIYDVEKVKSVYGDKLAFWGGISTQHVLAHGTPEDVIAETKKMLKIMGKNGGYIAAPTHSVPRDVPAENILAFIETVKNQ